MASTPPYRLSASILFLIDGIGFGIWAALLPSFKAAFQLDEASLSVAMLGMVLGALVSMPLAGRAIPHVGSKFILTVGTPIYLGLLTCLVLSPQFAFFVAFATAFGVTKGFVDISINTQAVDIEKHHDRPMMSSFQALWSLGGLIAAALTGIALKWGQTPLFITLSSGISLTIFSFYFSRTLYPKIPSAEVSPTKTPEKKPRGHYRQLAKLGFLAFLVLFTEGVMMDWSSVYAHKIAGAADWLAPFSFGVFSFAMASGRLTGDRLILRYGRLRIMKFGAWITFVGVTCLLFFHHWSGNFLGMLLIGFGMANLIPIIFMAAGKTTPANSAAGVSTVASIGYLGFLLGPVLIGLLAHYASLPVGFSLLLGFSIVIALFGWKVIHVEHTPES